MYQVQRVYNIWKKTIGFLKQDMKINWPLSDMCRLKWLRVWNGECFTHNPIWKFKFLWINLKYHVNLIQQTHMYHFLRDARIND